MAVQAARCAQCDVEISDPTTQVVHGGRIYCCPNCSAAMEETGSGSDPRALRHDDALRCTHCNVPIVDEATMQSRGDDAFCCANCASAM
jgi:DNA-directed RNA polymerase subunit RPC12/RpoP